MVILCTIDLETREVSLPAGQVIASYDHNVDVIRFQVETIPGFSLNTSSIKIAAQGPNNVRHDYAVDPSTVAIEEETGYITFDWPIPAGVTEMPIGTFKYGDKGRLIFAVCAEIISGDTVSKAWHSDDGIITVVAHLEPESGGGEDPEEEATNAQKIGQLQTATAILQREISGIASGTPPTASSTSEMDSDESTVYINTTDGKWYYYNGTAWVVGGTYGGAVTDTTLSISGSAADAKAVGDALAEKADTDDVGDLSQLETTTKDNLVSAINETVADVEAIGNEFANINGRLGDLKAELNNSTSNLAAEAEELNGYYISATGDISPLATGRNNSTIYVEAQPNKRYLIKKTNDTLMRVGLGASAGLTSGRLTQYSGYIAGESDTVLYVTTTDTFHFIYITLFEASTEETIAKNIATLAIVEDMSTELYEKNVALSSEISTVSSNVETLRNDVFVDGNIISVSSANMNHSAGDANIAFGSADSFSYVRASAVNNQLGFTFDTEPQKEYTLTTSIKGVTGGYVKVYICPTATYDTGKALASTINITTDTDVSLTFTAITAESSIWFMVRYNVPAINVTGLYCSDGVLRFKYNMMEYPGEDISTFSKILCVGDSITEGTFNYTQGGNNGNVITISKYSYPTQLEKITGCNTVNMGHGGYTAAEWYARHSGDDLSGYDCAIIGFGINDSLENVSISDFTSAYHSIIDKLETANKGIKIFLLTIIPAYTDYNRRFDAYNIEIKRIAIEDYANAYLVDMTKYSACKYGTAYAQGHLTAIGYTQMAKEIATIVSYIIHNNLSAFRNVQFIGTDYTYTEES